MAQAVEVKAGNSRLIRAQLSRRFLLPSPLERLP
jgi:hypothetical protein